MIFAFANIFDLDSPYVSRPRMEKPYSRTMHYAEVQLLQREFMQPAPDGFTACVVYNEE